MKKFMCLCALVALICGCSLDKAKIFTDFCAAYPAVCQYIVPDSE